MLALLLTKVGENPLFRFMPGRDHPHRQASNVPGGTVRESEQHAHIRRIAEPILNSLGLVLVDIEARGRGNSLLRLVIERPESEITVEDCERAHILIGHALDVDDPIPHRYVLEVSSPGLDRPLRTLTDYARFQGRLARFKLTKPVEGQTVLIGRIQKLQGTELWIEGSSPREHGRAGHRHRQQSKTLSLPICDIQEARLEVEF
jgi:ribosome maturation factor RimP